MIEEGYAWSYDGGTKQKNFEELREIRRARHVGIMTFKKKKSWLAHRAKLDEQQCGIRELFATFKRSTTCQITIFYGLHLQGSSTWFNYTVRTPCKTNQCTCTSSFVYLLPLLVVALGYILTRCLSRKARESSICCN